MKNSVLEAANLLAGGEMRKDMRIIGFLPTTGQKVISLNSLK